MQAKDGTQLDPGVVALVKSIRKQESGGDYNAVGDNGTSHGAYQYQKGTWEGRAKEFGFDPKDFSPTNQDKVTYQWALARKNAGWTPEMIAAGHNTSEENAKSGAWKTMKGDHTYDDGKVIGYDVPKYVNNVISEYQKQKNEYLKTSQGGSAVSAQEEEASKLGSLSGRRVQETGQGTPIGETMARGAADMLMDPLKKAGYGTHNIFTAPENDIKGFTNMSGNYVNTPGYINGEEATPWQTTKQVAGTGLEVASDVVPFLKVGKAALMARPILASTGLGYSQDVAQNLEEGKDIISKDSALMPGMGTAVGFAFGLLGSTAQKLLTPTAKLQEEAYLSGIEGMRNRVKTTDNAFVNNTITRTVDGKTVEITPLETLIKEKAPLPDVVTSGGTASANMRPAIDKMNSLLDENEGALIDEFKKQNFFVDPVKLKEVASQVVANTKNIAGIGTGKVTREEVATKLVQRIDNLITEYKGKFDGEAIRKILVDSNHDYEEGTKDVTRLLGDSMRAIIYDTPTGKARLNRSAELITARNFAEALNGKKVAGGGLGRIVARMVGQSVASAAGSGPLGLLLGGEAGVQLGKVIQKMTFLSPTGEVKAAIINQLTKIGLNKTEIQQAVQAAKTLPVNATVEDVAKSPEAPQSLRDLLLKASRATEDSSLEKYIPESELPTIDMGKGTKSKYNKSIPGLPSIRY